MTNGKKYKAIRRGRTRVKSGPSKRLADELAEKYLPLVSEVAQGVFARLPLNSRVDPAELRSAGGLGLHKAIVRFKEGKSRHPDGYFRLRIWGSMMRMLQDGDVLSRLDRDRLKRIQRRQAILEQKLGRSATTEEIGRFCRLNRKEWSLINGARATQHSFESIDDESCWNDSSPELADPKWEHPADRIIRREVLRTLRQAADELPDFPRKVIVLIFFEDLEAKKVAEHFKVTEAYISRSKRKAVGLLREALKDADLV